MRDERLGRQSAGPPAEGVRQTWNDLPQAIQQAIETYLGAPVVAATSQAGGLSPGLASRILTADGRRVFVKAAGPVPNEEAPRMHRREAAIARLLPTDAPVSRLLWTYDEGEGGWITLIYEDVAGNQPQVPWLPAEFDRLMAAVATLHERLTPSPIAAPSASAWFERQGSGWAKVRPTQAAGLDDWSARHLDALIALEARAPAASVGTTLLHFDIRADNVLFTQDRVVFVDWPHAHIGAPWVDVVFMAPCIAMQSGPAPEVVFAAHPASSTADQATVTAVLAAVAGFFIFNSLQPPPPGLPTLRPFQAAQGEVAVRWLAHRTGWR